VNTECGWCQDYWLGVGICIDKDERTSTCDAFYSADGLNYNCKMPAVLSKGGGSYRTQTDLEYDEEETVDVLLVDFHSLSKCVKRNWVRIASNQIRSP
jgi:hypothetical protein